MSISVLGIADDRALGSSVRVIVTRPQSLTAAKAAVDRVLREIDAAASRFREDSELSRLNSTPDRVVKVSPLLAQAIEQALRGAKLTEGAVDPTVGHAMRLAGYDADFGSVPPFGEGLDLVAQRVPGWQSVQFSPATRTVLIPRGVELDLGATAKALACDRAATAAAAVAGGALVGIGGDIAVAGTTPADGWPVRIVDDHAAPPDAPGRTVAIRRGGLATSSMTVRRWRSGAAELHHLVDPRTGRPAESPWRTVTVAAKTCVDANVASTASFLLEDAPAWLEARHLPARLVHVDGESTLVAGWPEDAR